MSDEMESTRELQEMISNLQNQLSAEREQRYSAEKIARLCREEVAGLKKAMSGSGGLADIDGLIVEQCGQQAQNLKELESRLMAHTKRELQNAVKQLEAYMGIQSFMTSGEASLDFHGWPISSDIALFLIKLLVSEEYDLVVELGSGTSTVIMAKALKLGSAHGEPRRSVGKRITSFEHSAQYLEKTLAILTEVGCEEFVDLVHSPLEELSICNADYLYYSCEKKLGDIASSLVGQKSKILVFIDGPPAATCEHARFPVMPVILRHFAGHELHFLLDDFNRAEEKAVVKMWEQLLREQSFSYTKEELRFEKGALLLKVGYSK